MANIVVTSSANNFIVEFNDYASFTGIKKAVWEKLDISFQLTHNDEFVRVCVKNEPSWAVTFDGNGNTLQIDMVVGVAPTSNSDLYDKLIALII